MIIKGIKYARYPELPREWRIVGRDDGSNDAYAAFGNLNLLVGKNATGKSRTLAAISELAYLMSGRQLVEETNYHSQEFDFIFGDDDKEYRYVLRFKEKQILEETLYLNKEEVMSREKGFMYLFGEKQHIPSGFNPSHLLVCAKRENKDLYFPDLVFWAVSMRIFKFSDQIELNSYVEDLNLIEEDVLDAKNLGVIIPVFYWSRKQYGQKFEDEILECMNELGYRLTDIDIKKNKRGYSITVEEERKYLVSQQDMSQGMFRALALFVMIINAKWRKLSMCILVDDMGEGLDHERSKSLIDIVVKKTYNTQIQYFMSSNDRYVMNNIHLKYWSVVERVNSKSIFYNIDNSKKNFEDFKYTGLNNFDFFTTDFYRDGFGADDGLDEEL